MNKYVYFTHVSHDTRILYRFPVIKGKPFIHTREDGNFIRRGEDYWNGNVAMLGLCFRNWNRLSRDQARKMFPKAFRKA